MPRAIDKHQIISEDVLVAETIKPQKGLTSALIRGCVLNCII